MIPSIMCRHDKWLHKHKTDRGWYKLPEQETGPGDWLRKYIDIIDVSLKIDKKWLILPNQI